MTLATGALTIIGVYLTLYVIYQAILFITHALTPHPRALSPLQQRRFTVLVPAHNEELYLPRLLKTLTSQHYPADRYHVVVIADNCSDGTAAVARCSGVEVLERVVPARGGKGHAIGWALDRIDLQSAEAIVIVDGDSLVEPEFLRHLNVQMERGDDVIQCYNGVANPAQSWFTRLMHVSRTIANEILHPAKRTLGLSSHLMGNGMCFGTPVIRSFGWNAFSVGEDWEYYARLVLEGSHVGYSREARVYHQESVNLRQASSQRLRWSGGRFQVLRRYGLPLFVEGLRRRSLICVDAAMPLILPNPSLGMNLTVIGLAASSIVWFSTGDAVLVSLFGTLALLQLAMFVVGVLHTKEKWANAASIVIAPLFLVWKLGIDLLSLGGAGTKQWKHTPRRLS